MAIYAHRLKFIVGTGNISQLPETYGDGIHSVLQQVMWYVGVKIPNLVFQFFHCARFCTPQLVLYLTPQENSQGFRFALIVGLS